MLSFLKKILLLLRKAYYSWFNGGIYDRVNTNKEIFSDILKFENKNRKFISKVFANQENLDCFALFIKKDKGKYSQNDIHNIFMDNELFLVKDQKSSTTTEDKDRNKNILTCLLGNDIPIYKDSPELSIKSILRMSIETKDQRGLLEKLLLLYRKNNDQKINITHIEIIFSYNASDIINKRNDLKQCIEFIDFLLQHSVNDKDIGEIFFNNNPDFDKMKDNQDFLKIFLKNRTAYDKIKKIFSFKDGIFNKTTDNLEFVECLLKYRFNEYNIEYCFSSKNAHFDVMKKDIEGIVKFLSEHKLNFSDIKNATFNEDSKKFSITFTVPSSKLEDISVTQKRKQLGGQCQLARSQ